MMMTSLKQDVYICLDEHVQTYKKSVYLKEMAHIYCTDSKVKDEVENSLIFSFDDKYGKKEVLSILYVYRKINENIKDEVIFYSIGATDCLVELVKTHKKNQSIEYIKVLFVSFVLFFGSAFSIMTYDQDAGVADVFATMYAMFHLTDSKYKIIELGYSIGVGLGVIVFFHHFEKRSERTPTAMEIQMNKYEKDMVEAYVKASERQGESVEVDSQ